MHSVRAAVPARDTAQGSDVQEQTQARSQSGVHGPKVGSIKNVARDELQSKLLKITIHSLHADKYYSL